MKPYSIDLREKIVQAYQAANTSVRKVAERFDIYLMSITGSCQLLAIQDYWGLIQVPKAASNSASTLNNLAIASNFTKSGHEPNYFCRSVTTTFPVYGQS